MAPSSKIPPGSIDRGLDLVRFVALLAALALLWVWIFLISQDQRPMFGVIGGGALTIAITILFLQDLRRRRSDQSYEASRDAAKTAEIALAEALEQAPNGVILVNADWSIALVNKAAIDLLKLPPHLAKPGVDGRDVLQFQMQRGDLEDDQRLRDLLKRPSPAALGARRVGLQQNLPVFERKTPEGRTLEIRTAALNDGRLIRTYTDVTTRVEAIEAREAALLSRSQFLSVMSHELKTPLNAVIGLSHVLQSDALTPAQNADLRRIEDAGRHLLEMVEEVLTVSDLDSGALALLESPFNLVSALRRAADAVTLQAQVKQLSITLDLGDDLPAQVIGDEERFRSLLLKLLDNAVKFTDVGGVTLSAALIDEDAEFHRVAITVSDTGRGMTEADRRRLFDPFTQGDGSTLRRHGGLGAGLTLFKLLLSAMGGTVTVTGAPGQGSQFQVFLPLRRASSDHGRYPLVRTTH